MKLIQGDLSNMKAISQESVVTIGNFDGVHRGHRYLIERTLAHAKELKRPCVVLSFSPHPSQFFKVPGFEPLLTDEKKKRLIDSLGVDILIQQSFNAEFSRVTKEDFLRHFLLGPLGPRALHLGYNFQFGANGDGRFLFAQSFLEPFGVEVIQEKAFLLNGRTVSSTVVRELLKNGDISQANELLCGPYEITGVIEKGDALGRTLGFPTANLSQVKTLVPGPGVYVGVASLGQKRHLAVLNIGVRPTISDKKRQTIECHILDFSDTIYGESLSFTFVERLRNEKKFGNVQELKVQLLKDVKRARSLIKKCDL